MIAQQTREDRRAPTGHRGHPEDQLQSQLKDAIEQEKDMEALYTPDHPDMIAIKRRIANLKAEIAHDAAAPAKGDTSAANPTDSPQLQQLKAQLRAEQQSMAAAKQEQARIEAAGSQLRGEDRIQPA